MGAVAHPRRPRRRRRPLCCHTYGAERAAGVGPSRPSLPWCPRQLHAAAQAAPRDTASQAAVATGSGGDYVALRQRRTVEAYSDIALSADILPYLYKAKSACGLYIILVYPGGFQILYGTCVLSL